MAIASVNPATGELLESFEPFDEQEIERRLALSASAFSRFRSASFADRRTRLEKAALLLEDGREDLGRLITREMGKPVRAAVAEVVKCAMVCRYYAENGEQHLRDETVATGALRSFIRYQPLGPLLAVMPWNFPFWQVFRFAAPALMAGNTVLLKHASNVPRSALAIESLLRQAGFEEGVFQTLLIGSEGVDRVLSDERIMAATLTGSEAAGRSVAAAAGMGLKKVVLELGGSDPFIVMPSADLADAVTTGVKSRTINNGQSCIAAKRFIVHEEIAPTFERLFVEAMKKLKVGDPMDEDVEIGPLATGQILVEVESQVKRSIALGSKLLTGGRRGSSSGNYYLPTVLSNIPPSAPCYSEEVFGPVALLFRVRDIDEAIRIANDTTFGLGASVWTSVEEEGSRFIEELQSGQVFVNAMVASDPRLPFGGIKRSGFGRELGAFGIREFVNIKTVWVND